MLLTPLKVVDSAEISDETISNFIPRTITQLDEVKDDVLKIIKEVKLNGDKAVIKFIKKFDQVELKASEFQVSEVEINNAYNNIEAKLLDSLNHAKTNLIKFHQAQKREEWTIEIEKGVKAGQVYRPIETVGIYIPGGRAAYPSTVLMAATPARVAGVKNVIMCTPPQKDKSVSPAILVAAKEFGIDKIFKVGGAQAIAAMAYGTKTIPKVQKVVGPGNKWVNAAKQILSNDIAIDTPAGPSEILIIADENTDYKAVIMDLLSQVEHDPDNVGVLVSDSLELIEKVNKNIDYYINESKRKEIIEAALKNNSLIVKAKDMNDCIRISDIIAPEHLEIVTKEPKKILNKINNAGAIFLGINSPVPLGDYSAGTNHILPTGGNAKKYSGLNIYDFLKVINILECDKEGLKNISSSAITMAEFEGLHAHKKSIEYRLKDKN